MCGIAGIVGPLARHEAVAAMIQAISHRGPDGLSVIGEADHVIGHARLAIIDIEGGQQPMISASGRWLIAFNGEIYNYRELRAQLEGRYTFETRSDTEVILAAIECHGLERGLAMIDGMYAIALFDRHERLLHVVRDHFGIKPLYYTVLAGGGVAFASEMKALVPLRVPFTIDLTSVVTQLLCRFIPSPYTGRHGIFKLQPGEWRCFAPDGSPAMAPRRVVPLALARALPSRDDYVTATAQLLSAAVRRQTVSDVPLGMLLSGGIDSALVAQIAADVNPDLHTYCIGYSASDRATEFVEASETAHLLGTVHKNIVVESHDFAEALRHALWHLEEPMATTSLVTYFLLCRAVAAERKVVLSGQGADEIWAGYSRHRFEAILDCYGPVVRALAPLGPILGVGGLRPRLCEILRQQGDETLGWVAYRTLFPLHLMRRVFGAALMDDALHRIETALKWAEGQVPEAASNPFSRLLVRDTYTDLSDNLLLLGDKLSMAHGLEVRVPLLDVSYASHVLRLPRHAKRDGFLMSRGKVVHKKVALRSLPGGVVNRPKKGFETPLSNWLAGDFGREMRATVFSSAAPLATLFPATELFAAMPSQRGGAHEQQQQLFSFWVTNEWMGLFR